MWKMFNYVMPPPPPLYHTPPYRLFSGSTCSSIERPNFRHHGVVAVVSCRISSRTLVFWFSTFMFRACHFSYRLILTPTCAAVPSQFTEASPKSRSFAIRVLSAKSVMRSEKPFARSPAQKIRLRSRQPLNSLFSPIKWWTAWASKMDR